MNITQAAIKRPLTTIMLTLAIGLFGVFAFLDLPVDLLPDTSFPVVTVTTVYPGAPATVVEEEVTKPIEDELFSLANLDGLQSTTLDSVSVVVVRLTTDADQEVAVAEVNKRLRTLQASLPQDIRDPVAETVDFTAFPILTYAFSGDNASVLSKAVSEDIVPAIERISGVGSVTINGLPQEEVRITLNQDEVQARGITLAQIQSILTESLALPVGALDEDATAQQVVLRSSFTSLDELRELQLPSQNPTAALTTLNDIATIERQVANPNSFFRLDGESAVSVGVIKQPGASTVEVANAITTAIDDITLDASVTPVITFNQAESTEDAVDGSLEALLEGIVLTALLLLLFLRSPRSSLIVLVAIPTSLLVTFLGMSWLGFTLNILSLLAISLAIGILVDDSIVVIENIIRVKSHERDPKLAAEIGRREIAGAAIAITLVDVVVFLPIAILGGLIGQFFAQFALVIVVSTLTSLAVSFTLTPMLSAYLLDTKLRHRGLAFLELLLTFVAPAVLIGAVAGQVQWQDIFRGAGWGVIIGSGFAALAVVTGLYRPLLRTDDHGDVQWLHWFESGIEWLKKQYLALLRSALSTRWSVIVLVLGLSIGAFALPLTGKIPVSFIPTMDDGTGVIEYELPVGTPLETVNDDAESIEAVLTVVPDVDHVITQVGGERRGISRSNLASFTLDFGSKRDREQSSQELTDASFQRAIEELSLAGTLRILPNSGPAGAGQSVLSPTGDLSYELLAPDDATLLLATEALADAFDRDEHFADISTSLAEPTESIVIRPKPELYRFGLRPTALLGLLRGQTEAVEAGTFTSNEDQVPIVLGLDNPITTIHDLQDFPIAQIGDQRVALGDVASIAQESTSPALSRTDKQRSAMVSVNIADDGSLGGAVVVANDLIDSLKTANVLPKDVTVRAAGTTEIFAESAQSFALAIIVSLVLVYMVLVSLYESFAAPFVIMFSIPTAFIGAFLALWISGQPIDLLSALGLIMLMGLVAKNGILLVDVAKSRLDEGSSVQSALMEAGRLRFRPILMTTISLIAASIPLALGFVPGAELRVGVATVFIGGLTSSLILTLFFVPVMFSYIVKAKHQGREKGLNEY